jgi:hypothetical protein
VVYGDGSDRYLFHLPWYLIIFVATDGITHCLLLTALEPSIKLEYAKQKWDKPAYDKGVAALEKTVRYLSNTHFEILISYVKIDTYYVPPTPLPPEPRSTAGTKVVLQ